jgi:hypothetical protein
VLLSLCQQTYSLNSTNIFRTCTKSYRWFPVFFIIWSRKPVIKVIKIEINNVFFESQWNICLNYVYKVIFSWMGQSSTNGFYDCSANFATLWKSTCCWSIKFSNCFLTYIFFRKKCLRQPSIDFDFCNLSSSGDVVYKERWWHWHKLVTDLFYDFVSILLV